MITRYIAYCLVTLNVPLSPLHAPLVTVYVPLRRFPLKVALKFALPPDVATPNATLLPLTVPEKLPEEKQVKPPVMFDSLNVPLILLPL